MEFYGGPRVRKKRQPVDVNWLQFMSDEEKEAQRIEELRAVSLAESGLPLRTVNALEDHGILTIGDLAQQTSTTLRAIPNLGEVTLRKCRRLLAELQIPGSLHHE